VAGPFAPLPRRPAVQPKLTFALPVYNEGEAALRAAKAVLDAAGRLGWPFRVLVYDDGSTDDLGALEELAEEDREPGERGMADHAAGRIG